MHLNPADCTPARTPIYDIDGTFVCVATCAEVVMACGARPACGILVRRLAKITTYAWYIELYTKHEYIFLGLLCLMHEGSSLLTNKYIIACAGGLFLAPSGEGTGCMVPCMVVCCFLQGEMAVIDCPPTPQIESRRHSQLLSIVIGCTQGTTAALTRSCSCAIGALYRLYAIKGNLCTH